MNRLHKRMRDLSAEGRTALVIYLTFGDPSPEATVDIVRAAAEAGADVIELGVPFSDPNADGVVIQEAMQRALAAGADLESALACAADLRAGGCETPLVLFGYYNPIFIRGVEAFAEACASSGVDAVLTVDLPIDEIDELRGPLGAHGVGVVPLVAPTSTPARIARVAELDAPFVYYISRTGITGSEFKGASGGAERVTSIREATGAPVCVGFGIRTGDDARAIGELADGVVVGSEVVRRIADGEAAGAAERVAALIRELRSALDR